MTKNTKTTNDVTLKKLLLKRRIDELNMKVFKHQQTIRAKDREIIQLRKALGERKKKKKALTKDEILQELKTTRRKIMKHTCATTMKFDSKFEDMKQHYNVMRFQLKKVASQDEMEKYPHTNHFIGIDCNARLNETHKSGFFQDSDKQLSSLGGEEEEEEEEEDD